MKAKFSLSLRQRLSASPASSSLRERLLIQTDPLQTDFSVDLTCCAARHAPYCGGLLCRGASCYCASCGRQSNPLFLGTFIQPIFFVRPRGRREGLVLHPPPSSSPLFGIAKFRAMEPGIWDGGQKRVAPRMAPRTAVMCAPVRVRVRCQRRFDTQTSGLRSSLLGQELT